MTTPAELYLAHLAFSAITRADGSTIDRSEQMYLLTEELARNRISQRRSEADAQRLVRQAVLARRAKRKTAKKSVLRARVVALATR
ncbi:MAG: hypothetical protein ABIM89_11700 [Mycobacteriales bacterium]